MDNENKTISYWDLVWKIHPDIAPDIQNPSEKMEEATHYKNDEHTLYRLAVKWRLVKDDSISKVDTQYVVGEGKIIKINQQYEGIIVDFIKKGELMNIIVWINGGFRSFKRNNIEDQDNDFYIVGYADDDEYTDLDWKYQMLHGQRQEG